MHEQTPEFKEEQSFRETRLGRIALSSTMGVAWGVGTFEAFKGLDRVIFNQPFTSVRDQLTGLAIFGIGGGAAFGRFVYKQISKK